MKEAGRLLKLSANGVRAQAKKGKIPYETDNRGKLWVFISPEMIAAQPSKNESPEAFNEPSLEVTMEVTKQAFELSKQEVVKAFESHIETLKAQLADLPALREKAADRDRLEVEATGLKAQISLLNEQLAEARRLYEREAEERQRLTAALTTPADEEKPQKIGRWKALRSFLTGR